MTFDEGSSEARFLNGSVGNELNVEPVGGRLDVGRHFGATKLPYQPCVVLVTVPHLDVIVDTMVVVFHLEKCKSNGTALQGHTLAAEVLCASHSHRRIDLE